jgi:cell division protein FtsQ
MHLSIAPDDWNANLNRLGVVLGDLARRNELSLVREVRAADGNVWVIRKS